MFFLQSLTWWQLTICFIHWLFDGQIFWISYQRYTQFVTLWKTCTVWWPVLHTIPPLSQWAIFLTVWKEKLGKMLIKIWWLDIGVTYELTVCTVWCTVHSPVLEWAEWGETTLSFLLCTLETGPYWALSQAAELYSAAHSLAGSMFQIVTRCSA